MNQIKISDESCVSAARRSAILLASQLEWDETTLGKLAIIVTELATNILKYAGAKGELLLQFIENEGIEGIEVLALDKGPGMGNITQCLNDGYSTQGTAGTGLGAVKRLANFFTIYSIPTQGTIALAQIWSNKTLASFLSQKLLMKSICLPKPGEQVCGDSRIMYQTNERVLFLIADGLGHGPDAAKASQLACQEFSKLTHLPIGNIIVAIDEALQKTRGAAIAIAEIEFAKQTLRFAGLGNITGVMYKENMVRHLMTRDGIAGLGSSNIQEFVYPWDDNALLILHSDGLATLGGDSVNKYPGLLMRHPAIIAGIFYRDFNRGYDDITVMAICKNSVFPSINYDNFSSD